MVDSLKQRIQEDMKNAMRAKDSARLGTIRLLMAAMKQREVDERISLDDANIIQIINKMIKQRRESIVQYEAGNRPDLAQKEKDEIEVLQVYLPKQLSGEEIESAVRAAIKSAGASSVADMGKVMNLLKDQLSGRADMSVVSATVKKHLS